jgi:pectinesterase
MGAAAQVPVHRPQTRMRSSIRPSVGIAFGLGVTAVAARAAQHATPPPPAPPPFTVERVLEQLSPVHDVAHVGDDLPAGVRATEDLVYSRPDGIELRLDLYRPEGAGPLPAVLVVHGGGWDAGSRQMERPLARQLAARGFVTAPVTYRLGAAGRFPAALHDLKAAVRWLRANAAAHGIDPDRIGVIGGSAGGQLAALLGASNGVPTLEGAGEHATVSSRVQAVVDIDGAASFPDAGLIAQEEARRGATSRFLGGTYSERAATWFTASPLTHVSRDSAPTLFINSTAERPVLPGRQEMSARLRALGVASHVVVVPETPHPFWLVHPWFQRTLDEADAFLQRHLRGREGAPVEWRLDSLSRVAGHAVTVVGTPRVVATPVGSAIEFNGESDGLVVDANPIEGLSQFTIEILFEPAVDGQVEQRFLHVQEAAADHRALIELRMLGEGRWCLDTFLKHGLAARTLIERGLGHPAAAWHVAALVFDGQDMAHYVDGVRETGGPVAFKPLGGGSTSIGVRMNRVSWFKGRIARVRVTPYPLVPREMLPRPAP